MKEILDCFLNENFFPNGLFLSVECLVASNVETKGVGECSFELIWSLCLASFMQVAIWIIKFSKLMNPEQNKCKFRYRFE